MTHSKILIAYASRSGSTEEIAQFIGTCLKQAGLEVDVLPVSDVRELSIYQAIVVGSAIRKSAWLPEAIQFVQTHRSELSRKPFATFTVCITLAMSNSDLYRQAVSKWIQPVHSQVKPLSEGLFPGRLEFSRLSWNWDTMKLRLVVALGIFPKEDRRDWNAVRTWANQLHPLLIQEW